MPRFRTVESTADEEIRKAVAAAINAGAVIDVRFVGAAIADRIKATAAAHAIETQLAEAAVAARVAIYL